MAMVKRRVSNPPPAVLALVNPKRGRKMATRKRRHTSRRRRTVAAAVNPRRRRRTATVRHRRSTALLSTRRRRNPSRRRHHRRRNPVRASLFAEGTKLAISGALIGFTQPFVRGIAGQWVGSSPIASAAITFGTAYGLSFLSRLTSFTRKLEDPLLLSGATIAVAQLISSYVLPLLRPAGGAVNPTMSGRYGAGMRGIAAVPTTVPPGYAPLPPPPPQAAANGMRGIAAYPTPGSFRR